jgi:hypothetical protein
MQVHEQQNKDRICTGTETCKYRNSRRNIGYVQEQGHIHYTGKQKSAGQALFVISFFFKL